MKNEKSLIEAFRNGDDFAFISLYNRYKEAIFRFCAAMMSNRELAQDAMQETFIRVYENRRRLLKTDAFKSWVYAIARNQCLNMLRTQKRWVPLDDEIQAELIENARKPLEKREQIAMVTHCISQLKPDYREVIVLREYQNLTYAEIAAITRSTLPAVKSRLFKARRKLAATLRPLIQQEERLLNAETS